MSSILSVGGGGNVGAAGGFYPYSIDQSLRFNDDDSAYLSRTPASAGNRKTSTLSVWVKRSKLGADQVIFTVDAAANDANRMQFRFGSGDDLRVAGQNTTYLATNAKFRDVSSWYHIVLAIDTTQATASDRLSLYVNGEKITSLSASSYPSQNADLPWNLATLHGIGSDAGGIGSGNHFDGYMAEVNFIDGTALDPTSFGETINGIWVPKAYSGSYGTNGFYLSFADSSAIGDDLSGNTNDFTANNLAANDVVPDSPTNGFATFNPLDTYNYTLSEGNLKAVNTTNNRTVRATTLLESGKWYWEVRRHNTSNDGGNISVMVGVAKGGTNIQDVPYTSTGNYTYSSHDGVKYTAGSSASYGDSWRAAGDIVGIAFDADAGVVWFSKNGTWQNGATTSEIAAGTTTNAAFTGLTDSAGYIPIFARTGGTASNELDVNFGQNPSFNGELTSGDIGTESGDGSALFKYAPPSGFLAICSANLPEPTIGPNSEEQADDYFNTVLWTGNATTRDITVGFQPDFTWIKARSTTSHHAVFDSVRGVLKELYTSKTDAESSETNGLSQFNSDGFRLLNARWNSSGVTYVGWNWKAGGTAVSNTDGSITSQVSAAPDAGFSIVSYTGDGGTSGKTVGHGLTDCEFVIVKNRDDTKLWFQSHKDLTTDYYLNFDTGAENSISGTGGGGASIHGVTDTFKLLAGGTNNNNVNTLNDKYIAYCFQSVEGFSRATSYVGNGSTDGTFCFLGHRPAWIMLKNASASGAWYIFDVKRNTYNVMDKYLRPNLANAEGTLGFCDFTSNGFKIRSSAAEWNGSGNTIIVLSFAEAPFKYANAR